MQSFSMPYKIFHKPKLDFVIKYCYKINNAIRKGHFLEWIVIVTGGTSGIGFATAKISPARTKSLFLDVMNVEDAVKELQKEGEVTFMKADVSVVDDCCHVVSAVMEKYGRLDVLVNAAGVVGTRGNFVDLDLLISRTPLTSTFYGNH